MKTTHQSSPKIISIVLLIVIVFTAVTGFSQGDGNPGKLGVFTDVPKFIADGYCIGLFTPDSITAKTKNYILVTNIEKFALIKVDGKTIKLALNETISPANKSFKRTFSGNGYRAVLTTKDVSKKEEQGMEAGILEITHDKTRVVIKVHGEAGCD